jgi:Tol biopolymer transport system component
MTRSTPTLRRLLLAGATATLTGLAIGQIAVHGSAPLTKNARRDTAAAVSATDPALSADGRYMVFVSASGQPRDGVGSSVWLRDRSTDALTELTLPQDGTRDGNSRFPAISADGCFVAAVTEIGYDLFRDDDRNTRWDVYRLQLPGCGGSPGDWKLVSAAAFGGGASDTADPTDTPAISGSGAVVAYTHAFSVDEPDIAVVTVVDLTIPLGEPGRAVVAQGTPSELPNTPFRYRGIRHPSITDDGAVVTYTSDAQSALAIAEWGDGPTPGGFATSQVYAWSRGNPDRTTAVTPVSFGAGGVADGEADHSVISASGQFIAFQSTSTNLVDDVSLPPCVPDCVAQIYRFDRLSGSTTLVSRVPSPTPVTPAAGVQPVAANASSIRPSITADGSEIAYVTRATNLFATRAVGVGGPDDGDIVVAQVDLGTAYRASNGFDGLTPAPAANGHPVISSAGRVIAFDTFSGSFFGLPSPSGGDALAAAVRQVVTVNRAPMIAMADLDVGSVSLGYPGAEWYVGVINQGPGSFLPAVVVSSNPQFVVTGGSCQTGAPVPPGGSCRVQVMLSPTELGPLTGTLTVSEFGFSGASVQSSLFGAGGDAVLDPSPAGADMGTLIVGQPSQPVSFNITNVGFGPTSVASLSVRGDHPKDFKVVSSGCAGATLAIGKPCSVDVVFTPTAAGHRTATIVAATPEGFYTTILVNGDGRYAPTMAASAGTVVAGSRIAVVGTGFAPNAAVLLQWADGTGLRAVVTTDKNGNFLELLLVPVGERTGVRQLVAQVGTGESSTLDIEVQRSAVRRPSAGNWPGK